MIVFVDGVRVILLLRYKVSVSVDVEITVVAGILIVWVVVANNVEIADSVDVMTDVMYTVAAGVHVVGGSGVVDPNTGETGMLPYGGGLGFGLGPDGLYCVGVGECG